MNPEFTRYLDDFCQKLGVERSELRVLDWGCGRGQLVAQLRELGYDAHGADINRSALEEGRSRLAQSTSPEASTRLFWIDESGHLEFPDGYFHAIVSETVLEHVRDLETVAVELNRLMATPSMGLHVFPPYAGIVEQHLEMPFVHWLPKNRMRKLLIAVYSWVGIEPRWVPGESLRDKTRRYFDYSVERTYYRKPKELIQVFRNQGFKVESVAGRNPKVRNHRILGRLSRAPLVGPCVAWAVRTFKMEELRLEKPPRPTL